MIIQMQVKGVILMPDIYCSHCGEPWDVGELHDVPGMTVGLFNYGDAANAFMLHGCGIWIDRSEGDAMNACSAPIVSEHAAQRAARLHAISAHPEEWF
jgi:hypothetical protein